MYVFGLSSVGRIFIDSDWLQTLMNVRKMAAPVDTIAMATLNASTLLDHTTAAVYLATSILILTPASVFCPCLIHDHSLLTIYCYTARQMKLCRFTLAISLPNRVLFRQFLV